MSTTPPDPDARTAGVHVTPVTNPRVGPTPQESEQMIASLFDKLDALATETIDVPPPAGAIDVAEWEAHDDGLSMRLFNLAEFPLGGELRVVASGYQLSDGTLVPQVLVYPDVHPDVPLSIEAARALAGALLGAADRLEEMPR